MFINRTDAGEQLTRVLSAYKKQPVIVYALPRGDVVLGVEIAGLFAARAQHSGHVQVLRFFKHPVQRDDFA